MVEFSKYLLVAIFLMVLTGNPVLAVSALATPEGNVLLEVAGEISIANKTGEAHFDADMLAALPQHEIRTNTPWTDGVKTFSGPKFFDLLVQVGAQGEDLILTALNDYQIEIPVADLKNYPVILATHLDGNRLRVRDKGPVWVIYPWSEHAELNSETYFRRSIWQLRRVTVK